jgi:hypothetical protein
MAFARANREYIQQTGEEYERRLRELAGRHPGVVERMEGRRHLASLFFRDTGKLSAFVKALNDAGIDISIQSYKAKCPPSCLTKLPLVVTPKTVDFLVGRMDAALADL